MARYERFDDDISTRKLTTVPKSNNEKLELVVTSEPTLSKEDEATVRHALITLNIISVFISTVCGIVTCILAVEDQSVSTLSFAVDTILDVLTFLIIIWRFSSSQDQLKREILILRILSILFIMSGLSVFIDSILDIIDRTRPIPSHYLAIALGIQTCIFFCLATAKCIVARKLNVISAYSDAFNTSLAALTALSLTVSIVIYNSNVNIWYIDPILGMFISTAIIVYGIWMMFKSFQTV
jgi:divalent metal cation (Fe/Co/Zn/Cd) transporter